MMKTMVDAYFWLLRAVIAVLLAAMVVLVFGNVVLRYGFNSGIAVSEELSRWLFVWMMFLGAIVGLREHAHLGIDSLVKRAVAVRPQGLLRPQPRADALCLLAAVRRLARADDDQLGYGRRRRAALSMACSMPPASCSASPPA